MSTTTSELHQKVEEAIKSIRPYLEEDGGDVEVIEVSEEGVVYVKLLGACGTCPMSPMTMKAGVAEAVMKAVPEITAVEAINMPEAEQN